MSSQFTRNSIVAGGMSPAVKSANISGNLVTSNDDSKLFGGD